MRRQRLAGELADDLLEDILEGDHALDVAVLVDDERRALASPLELHELLVQRRALRNEVGLLDEAQQRVPVERLEAAALDQPFDVQDADDVVEAVPKHGQPRE